MFHGLLFHVIERGGLIAKEGVMTVNEVASGSYKFFFVMMGIQI